MKKIICIIFFTIVCICILISILSAMDLSFFGIRIFRVGSGSMEPYINTNDLIIIKQTNKYEINDVVTYRDNSNYITHRIVKIDGDSIITKGDANNTNDTSITKNDIIGKVIYHFKLFGFLSYLLLKPFSWLLIFIIGIFIIPITTKNKKTKGKHAK